MSDLDQCVANELVVLVQPEPAIYWKVQNKVPGLKFEVEQVRMDLLYSNSYMLEQMPEAYERLLLEALVNDHSHFVSQEELQAQATPPATARAPLARPAPCPAHIPPPRSRRPPTMPRLIVVVLTRPPAHCLLIRVGCSGASSRPC